jgi:RNA polymerase sigma factor (TIGR02999 family)
VSDREQLTRWLNDWVEGDQKAFDRIAPIVYQELRAIARQMFGRERDSLTLQPTALVHEAYGRLIGLEIELANREHFYALAARTMRHLLINQARARNAAKRGGQNRPLTLQEDQISGDRPTDVLALDEALTRLAEHDPRKAEILELSYFGGLTHPAIAKVLGISPATVVRDKRVATLWMRKFMSEIDGN